MPKRERMHKEKLDIIVNRPQINMVMKRWFLNLKDEIHRQGLGIRRSEGQKYLSKQVY